MEGISFLTVTMLVLGLAAHGIKQVIAARKANPTLKFFDYYSDNGLQTALSVIFAIVAYALLPELAAQYPDALGVIGVGAERTGLTSFLIGFLSGSIADFFGNRFNSISGAK